MKLCDLAFVALAVATMDRALFHWRFRALDWSVAGYLAGSLIAIRPAAGLTLAAVVLAKQLSLVAVYVIFARLGRIGLADFSARVVVATAVGYSAAALAAAVMFLVSGVSLRLLGEAMPLPYVGDVFRLFGGTDSPELFACFLVFAIPFALAGVPVRARVASLILMGLASIGTFGHSIAGVLTAATVSLRPDDRHRRRQRLVRTALAVMACAAVVVVNLALAFSIRDLTLTASRRPHEPNAALVYEFEEPGGTRTLMASVSLNPMSYYLLKAIALDAFLDSPMRGAGLGSFHELTEQGFRGGKIHAPYRRADPHSTWLGRLAETGAIGGATLVALWIVAARVQYRLSRSSDNRAVGQALLGATAGLALAAINVDVMNFRFLWIGFGLARGVQERLSPAP